MTTAQAVSRSRYARGWHPPEGYWKAFCCLVELYRIGIAAGLRTFLVLSPQNTRASARRSGHLERSRTESSQLSLCPDQSCAHPPVFRGERYHAGNQKGNSRNDRQEYPQEANAKARPSDQSPPEPPLVLMLHFPCAHAALHFSKRCGNFDPPTIRDRVCLIHADQPPLAELSAMLLKEE